MYPAMQVLIMSCWREDARLIPSISGQTSIPPREVFPLSQYDDHHIAPGFHAVRILFIFRNVAEKICADVLHAHGR